MEHIVPASKGGAATVDNLALSCGGCNGHKHSKTEAKDPATERVVALYDPRRDRWTDHFNWDDEFYYLIGLSPTGRATAAALKLNREFVINLRRVLFLAGVHPPPDR